MPQYPLKSRAARGSLARVLCQKCIDVTNDTMSHWWTTTILLLVVRLFVLVHSQHRDHESLCEAQQTCSSCLQTPRCAWCSMTTIEQNASAPIIRCVSYETARKVSHLWCTESDMVYYENTMTMTENRPLSSTKGREPVQVQPQRIHLRLRRGEEQRVILKYKQAEDYPVDLYYLMDLSASMDPYREQLSKLGLQLAGAMQELTRNFRIGFGSFVDKVTLPMTSTQPDKLKVPCHLNNGKPCASPYSYINQMPLTENVMGFESEVQRAPVSGNLDGPEGGLEAMMQVIVCTAEIGWRQKARHLIVFSTDASSHVAGDGKLAGVIEPNDCKCHLDKKGVYNYFLEQDYPSISQINRKAREHNMNIIFAVPKGKNTTYSDLSRSISGSSIGILEGNSENVKDLVRGEYEKLVDTLTLIDTAPKMIDIKYFSKCLNKTGDLLERRQCEGLRVHNDIEFEIVLKVTECPTDPKDWKQTVNIKPRDLNESLTIDVEIMCDCPCEKLGNPGYRPNATECKGSGTSVCGVCSCNPDFYGKQCECKVNEVRGGNAISTADCKRDNQTDVICSGHGTCKCGVCNCDRRPNNPKELFYGKYCQCDNFSCQRSGGQVCGGKGRCDCGTCNCDPGWGGETCDCKETNSTCIPPSSGNAQICSGRGDCICGSCHCHEWNNIRYSGQYCEECPTCPGQRCEELKDCVECTVYKTGQLAKDGNCDLCPHEIDIVKVVEEDPLKDEETGAHICRTPGDEGCTFVFKYQYQNNRGDIRMYTIQAQEDRTCPAPINVLGVALGVVISTVVIGFLILLVWKILTMIHDKREYARFEKERSQTKFGRNDNPIFIPATTTFPNVMYDSTMDG
ncbi:PREDICTED: integrin beta-PS-like isoform X1 [Dinoponera quadriceps]|uniref:Integrin beta n=1 Tax=Dinoponera quadriceps TaxID=609295 RepID=A0A6P3XQL2_DINQU|nr:PREDICTED: integrin beta-PS-like isoform X1 [Dinoponera quadriceps]